MRNKFVWLSALALSFFMTSVSSAQVILNFDLNFRDSGDSLGDAIERTVNALPGDVDGFSGPIPFLVDADEDVIDTPGSEVVTVSLLGISSNDTGATSVNSGFANFGINSAPGISGGDSSTNLDSVLEEQFTISFNRPVEITEIDFSQFDDADRFQVGDRIINGTDAILNTVDDADLSDDPIIVAANTPILFAPLQTVFDTNSSVNLLEVRVNLLAPTSPTIPEPSSLALLGLGAIGLVSRRRRS